MAHNNSENESTTIKIDEENHTFPFDIRRFKQILLLISVVTALLMQSDKHFDRMTSVLFGTILFLFSFQLLIILRDSIIGSRGIVKILILLVKYPAIVAFFYIVSQEPQIELSVIALGYLLFLPALLIEFYISKRKPVKIP